MEEERPSARTLADVDVSQPISLKVVTRKATRELERQIILKVLKAHNWNRQKTAKWLKISYRSLLYKLNEVGATNAAKLERRARPVQVEVEFGPVRSQRAYQPDSISAPVRDCLQCPVSKLRGINRSVILSGVWRAFPPNAVEGPAVSPESPRTSEIPLETAEVDLPAHAEGWHRLEA